MRAKLIKKGMIYSPAHGDMAFTVPLFDEFMVRAILQRFRHRQPGRRVQVARHQFETFAAEAHVIQAQ